MRNGHCRAFVAAAITVDNRSSTFEGVADAACSLAGSRMFRCARRRVGSRRRRQRDVGLVISQIFGGGGNAGSPYTNDYVELFNRGASAVNVSGWTVQYATAAGTSWRSPRLPAIEPGAHQLVQLAGGTVGAPLPAPDATGTANLSAASGKVALVRDTAALACGASAGSCSALSQVEDLVGYGTAADFEGSAARTEQHDRRHSCGRRVRRQRRQLGRLLRCRACSAQLERCSAPVFRTASAAALRPPRRPTQRSTSTSSRSLARARAGDPRLRHDDSRSTPGPISERVTVLSNHASGYALSVRRTAFAPADLPLAIQATAPAGGVLARVWRAALSCRCRSHPRSSRSGRRRRSARPAATCGRPASASRRRSRPSLPGRYTATLTFTVIAR